MRWQRSLRLVIAAIGLATIVIVALTLRQRPNNPPAVDVTRSDPKAVAESRGGSMTQATGLEVPGFVRFDRLLTYEDGSLKYVKPTITTDRAGRTFEVTGNEGDVAPRQTHVTIRGDVVLTASDGLEALTEEATWSAGEEMVRAPGLVEFSRGNLRGSGIGMTWDQPREVMWLLRQAEITIAPEAGKDPGARVVAGAAGLARRDKYLRFERGVTIARAGREMAADSALIYLTDDEQAVRAIELRGDSSIREAAPADGGLEAMEARDINLTYGPDGESLQRAALAGDAAIQLAGTGGAGRRIAGQLIDASLDEAGALTALKARDRVALTLPAARDAPERTIRADRMDGAGRAGRGLTSARFEERVEYLENRPAGPRVARSRTLEIALSGPDGALDDARFAGGTRFEDGETTATAERARYLVGDGRLDLSGATGGRRPQVQDARLTVEAAAIQLAFEGPALEASGDVKSVLKPSGGDDTTRRQGSEALRTPGLLNDDQPANVTGAALTYDGTKGHAVYTGGARLWQGDTAISGDTITIDESSGDLLSSGSVRSTLQLDQVDAKTGERRRVPTIASAQNMLYEDALNRATYTTNAHVNGPQGDLRAVKIELYFVEGGGSLDRAEAYDEVRLRSERRTADGARMTYFAADERYVMTGAPVRTVDEECRETTCKTLTFYRSTDRILCDGNEENRTLTKRGGTCVEPPDE